MVVARPCDNARSSNALDNKEKIIYFCSILQPGHGKCALLGSSVTVPITNGKFNTGTWQGLWLCEHRYSGGESIVLLLDRIS